MFYVGVDLGQAGDSTALIIAEGIDDIMVDDIGEKYFEPHYNIRYLQRFALGTPYPRIVDQVNSMMGTEQLQNNSLGIIDGTGVGRPVIDMFRRLKTKIVPVVITGGDKETFSEDDGYWHVPKKFLVSNVQVLLGNEKVKFADDLPERQTLINEMMNFKIKVTASNNETYEAWREGQHDDIVIALCLALWYPCKFGNTRKQTVINKPHPLAMLKEV